MHVSQTTIRFDSIFQTKRMSILSPLASDTAIHRTNVFFRLLIFFSSSIKLENTANILMHTNSGHTEKQYECVKCGRIRFRINLLQFSVY